MLQYAKDAGLTGFGGKPSFTNSRKKVGDEKKDRVVTDTSR